jgi:hypothetical protein
MFLDSDLIKWLDMNRDEETSRSALVRILIRKAMKAKSRKKANTSTEVKVDPFSGSYITADLIPDDLKDYSDLLLEWWPIRKQKGGVSSTKVANRIFDKLRSFHIQDRKQALENAITGGWKDLFPIKKSKFEQEAQNVPKPKYFKASENQLPPTLAELGKTAQEMMENDGKNV